MLERRLYQETIVASCSNKNSLVVLPTGLGKTPIAMLLTAIRLEKHPGSKVLVLAPTKPLVEQHRSSFSKVLKLEEDELVVLTGKIMPKQRKMLWNKGVVFFATPQIVENDLINDLLDLSKFSLIVFDEAHRAVGDYAYVRIARKYVECAKHALILGLTASPGGTAERIGTICGNLFVENVEIRSESDRDVRPYVMRKDIMWVRIEIPEEMKKAIKFLEAALKERVISLKQMGLLKTPPGRVGKGAILQLQEELNRLMREGRRKSYMYGAMVLVASALKIAHTLELLQSQGVKQAYEFLEKLSKDAKTKSALAVINDGNVKKAVATMSWLMERGVEHPKMKKLVEVLEEELREGQKAIVFTQYVRTAEMIVNRIAESTEFTPVLFVGQRKGLTQKKQIETLERFRKGEYNILVASSVAEEGLDIPKVDLVVFYEPVPSEIRAIQRRGRTGRFREGKIVVMIGRGTVDEAYYWSSKHKERRMEYVLRKMKSMLKEGKLVTRGNENEKDKYKASCKKRTGQMSLDTFLVTEKRTSSGEEKHGAKPVIYADVREHAIIKLLSEMNAEVRVKQLNVGDFQISKDVGVERKKAEDFVKSITDGRLFNQLAELCENFQKPLLVVEGNDLLSKGNVHPNAIKGAIMSLAIDFRVPILFTKDEKDTAMLLVYIARRVQSDKRSEIRIRTKKIPKDEKILQEYIVAGLPGINSKLAKKLLEYFGSVRAVFKASELELQKVDGIGKIKARKISGILDKPYKKEE